jgi:hypothetical protein
MIQRCEPELVAAARKPVRSNPGFVTHGLELYLWDIIAAFELGSKPNQGLEATVQIMIPTL